MPPSHCSRIRRCSPPSQSTRLLPSAMSQPFASPFGCYDVPRRVSGTGMHPRPLPPLEASGTLGIHSPGARSNGHRSPIASLDHIAQLAQTVAPLLEDAPPAAGPGNSSSGDRFVGRGAGFADADPTGTAALDRTRRQMRAAVHRAATVILRSEDEMRECRPLA